MDVYGEISNGNKCSLCEKQLNWLHGAESNETPVALTIYRAICRECFNKLKKRYDKTV